MTFRQENVNFRSVRCVTIKEEILYATNRRPVELCTLRQRIRGRLATDEFSDAGCKDPGRRECDDRGEQPARSIPGVEVGPGRRNTAGFHYRDGLQSSA